MSEAYVGEIRTCGFNFAPRGWALCNGQILSISQNTALFSILGTTYGGDGRTNFALPNLQSRVPMHYQQGNGLSPRSLGEEGGEENVTLLSNQMPLHTHTANAANNYDSDQATPSGNIWGASSTNLDNIFVSGNPNTTMNPAALSALGGSQPHNNIQPALVVNFIICMQGIYPPRN